MRTRIHYKIVLPFVLVAVVGTVTTAALAISLVSRSLETRMRTQIDHVSEMVSESGFASNPSILEKLKLILDADIVTYDRERTVIASTLDPGRQAALLQMVQSAEVTRQLLGEGQRLVLRDLVYRGTPYTVAYRPLGSPADTIVAFVVPTLDIAATTRAVTRSIAVVALGTTLLIAGLGYLIARSITAPIEQLVVFARKLGTGDRSSRVDVKSRDEIGILARAFNDMADELQTSEEKVLRSERLATAGQLAAAVAHDIRNPLSSIRMQAQLLRTKLQPGEVNQQVLASILREIDRVERVVRGLLDLVKPVELDLKPVQVDELVEQALAIVEAQLAHRKIAVERRLDATLPSPLLDGDRIVQALLNVIENAADAMPTGGTLGIATSASADRSAIRIEVSDDGEGIRPDVRDKLFAPFFTTKREGIGLGLVNTRGIVERHGGSIELLAGRPRGTRAVITLPVAPPRAGGPWPTS